MTRDSSQPGTQPGTQMTLRRVAVFGIPVVLGLLAVLLIYHFWFSFPIGSGAAGPKVDRGLFGTNWTSRAVMVVGLGDSVTAGFGARKGYGYFDRLMQSPADDPGDIRGISLSAIFPRLECTNLAVSGSVSQECLEKQLPLLPVMPSNVFGLVVMTTGGNDLIHNYGRTPARELAMYGATMDQASPWITRFQHRLEQILSTVTNRFPGGCEIFIANIYDPTDGAGDIERAGLPAWRDGIAIVAAYNQVIKDCAEKHPNVHLVDMHGAFLGHGLHCTQVWRAHYEISDPHYWYYGNLEDPNERGYDAIRRLFLLEMAQARKRFEL